MAYKYYKKPSKYENDLKNIEATVESIDNRIEYDNKTKLTFYCESSSGKPQLCVYWEHANLNAGDRVILTGRFNEQGTFLCWDLQIIKKAQNG